MADDAVHTRRGRRSAITYLVILAIGCAVLAVVLPIGRRIVPAPQLPAVVSVSGSAADCLGRELAAAQSGVFLDVHVPADAGAASGDELGDRVARGRIDRSTGHATLRGSCADRTRFAGARFTMDMVFGAQTSGDPAVLVGVVAGGEQLTARLAAVSTAERNADASAHRLLGGDLVSRLFLAVAVVIVAARVIGYLFTRLRQPRVVGEIVAGILLGPSLVGLYTPSVTHYLFPPEVTSMLEVLAQFGLIFFMFLIGLELDHTLVRRSGHTAVLVSHVSIVLPFALGVVAALGLYPLLGSGSFSGFALFMGASLAVTALPVLARILTDTGIHRTRLGALSLTCAVVDDVTAWCILAFVVAVVKSTGAGDALQTMVLATGFALAMLFIVRPLVSRLAAVHQARGSLNPPVMAGIIVGLLLASWATQEIGIHAIFGAFMTGAMMPRSRPLIREITERLEDVTVLFLLPIFFAVVGLSTRFGLLDQTELWLVAGIVMLLAVVGKWGGSMIAARAAGQSWRVSNALGLLMNTRGLTGLVILSIGRSLGVISPALFTIMVLMALVTTFMAAPLLAITYPRRVIDNELARVAARERLIRGIGHGHTVLVAVANPVASGPLVEIVAELRAPDGTVPGVVLAHVVPPPGREEIRASFTALEEEAEAVSHDLTPLRLRLLERGVTVEVVTVVGDDPGLELVRLADHQHADLVVIGSHQPYLGRNPYGGATGALLEASPCDVAVVLAADGEPAASDQPVAVWFGRLIADAAALDVAAGLARGRGVGLRVVHPAIGTVPDLGMPIEAVVAEPSDPGAVLQALAGACLVVVGRSKDEDAGTARLRDAVVSAAATPVLVVQGSQASDDRTGSRSGALSRVAG